jgi:hypothetical protein
VDELTEKMSEDLAGSKRDGRKGKTTLDRPGMARVNDRPDILHATDGTDASESEKGLESKQLKTVRDEPCDLQAERGGLKVKDSDFKTK